MRHRRCLARVSLSDHVNAYLLFNPTEWFTDANTLEKTTLRQNPDISLALTDLTQWLTPGSKLWHMLIQLIQQYGTEG